MTIPSLFVAHGSPMLALEDNGYTRFLENLGRELPVPEAIAVFSAHWDEADQSVSVDETNGTMHDFYGFPDAMYELRYPAPGSPRLPDGSGSFSRQATCRISPFPAGGSTMAHGSFCRKCIRMPAFPLSSCQSTPNVLHRNSTRSAPC
ncbi:LigB family dioxygenase [Paenibacillus sp. P1XP2]|nr:LigB family dioxygenase [Paenibacillus sp. P1XP2]